MHCNVPQASHTQRHHRQWCLHATPPASLLGLTDCRLPFLACRWPMNGVESLAVYRAFRERKKAAEREADAHRDALRTWAQNIGGPSMDVSLQIACSSRDPVGQRCPVSFDMEWIRAVAPVSKIGEHIMSQLDKELLIKMRREWETRHLTIQPEDCPSLASVPGARVKKCMVAGFCVCSEDSRPLRLMVANFQSRMRVAFEKDSSWRQILEMKMVVLLFTSDGGDKLYYHISYEDLTTWEASLLRLVPDEDQTYTLAAQVLGKTALSCQAGDLEMQSAWMNVWEVCKGLDTNLTWSFQPFTLDSSGRLLNEFTPGRHILVGEACPVRSMKFWPLEPAAQRRRRRGQGRKTNKPLGPSIQPFLPQSLKPHNALPI